MDPNRMSFGSLGHPAAVPATPGLVATALALIINIYRTTRSLDIRGLAKLKG